MKKRLFVFVFLMCFGLNAQNEKELNHLSSYQTNQEGSAETVAYDKLNKRAVITNSSTNSISFIDITSVETPLLFKTVDLSTFGSGPNSVAIKNEIVAVAVESSPKQSPGKVIFFNLEGNFQKEIIVGSLPDMITFTPDGNKLLVANEGEPSDDYTIDPEGTVSIINLSNGLNSASVQTIDFNDYDNKKGSLENKGVRIFGVNATVSQDLEPEYITVTADGNKAYVNCQENNALVVINLNTLVVEDILPLGYKNHNLGTPTVTNHILNETVSPWPILGTPAYDGGQSSINLGGFSGLYFDENESTATNYVFYTIPDRGPNANAINKSNVTPNANQNLRPFKLPNYQGRIIRIEYNTLNQTSSLGTEILLTRADGITPISGRGNITGVDEVPVTFSDPNTEFANVDFTDQNGEEYHKLPYDPYGGDFEGIVRDVNGNFWMCDEYRPSIYKFDSSGKLIDRYVPKGTASLGTNPKPAGSYGTETLPSIYNKRRANRGFEAIAYNADKHAIYAFIQTPLYNRDSGTKNNSDVIRILEINANTGIPQGEYVYLLEQNKLPGTALSRVDKIGDAVYKGNGKFLVIERDSEDINVKEAKKYIYEIDITFATNILNQNISSNDGYTFASTTYLTESAGITDETFTPFELAQGFSQSLVVNRNTAELDDDFANTFGNWDMIALDPSNRFIYIPHEVGKGAGLTRYDTQTGDFVSALTGNNTGVFEINPQNWDVNNDDFGGIDPALWTPYNTVLTAEEWAGNGRLFEWLNPLMPMDASPNVVWRSAIPSVSHEGLKFDSQGALYFVDENNSGSLYKFVPKNYGDLSTGQTFVLKIDNYFGSASENWDAPSNSSSVRTGSATWIPITDENGLNLTSTNPFDFSNRGGRLAADELNATPYGRPEDLEIIGNRLYMAATSENTVYSIFLLNDQKAVVKIFADQNTIQSNTGLAVGSNFAKADNLAVDHRGNIFVIEDNSPGDIWITKDNDLDGIADSVSLWASLGVSGAEPTGLIATNHPNKFLVCIQHPDSGNDALWEINTNTIAIVDQSNEGIPLEELSAEQIKDKNILTVQKTKTLNLPSIGVQGSDKPEGLALLPNHNIAVINDNDFGIAGAGFTDNNVLVIISFSNNYGFDASNKDNIINISNHPTLGMFQPDGIKSYTVNNKSYIVTVNEGDARDYSGYSEELRVKDLQLNPLKYSNASTLQENENLGRLKTTSATGDYNNDGKIDQIYSYGARSFSIFDAYGNLVYDSGDAFAQKVLEIEPDYFNEDDGEKDGRSDDKGVEPEAIEIAKIGNFIYAFIGLERQSGIMVYDITDPYNVSFITYYNGNRLVDDVSPEIITHIPPADSPNQKDLLLVGYEVSGSLGIIEIRDAHTLNAISQEVKDSSFKIYPNPVINNQILKFNKPISGEIFNITGKKVHDFKDEDHLILYANLPPGVYIIKSKKHGSKRFIIL